MVSFYLDMKDLVSLRVALEELSGSSIPFEEILPGNKRVNKKILDNLLVNKMEVEEILKEFTKEHGEIEEPTALYTAMIYLFLKLHARLYKTIGKKVLVEVGEKE